MLPANKASMLRGGIGEMLLRMNCISNRECGQCAFEPECLVQRTMYSRMEITPGFMTSKDSVGYVLSCENYRRVFEAGETIEFTLTLLGKTIMYFSQYLQAVQSLGIYGMGRRRVRYRIARLTSTRGEPILEGSNVYMAGLSILCAADYVRYRWEQAGSADHIVFHTPTAIKHRGEMQQHLNAEALLAACARRVYMLNCFVGNDMEQIDWQSHVPEIEERRARELTVWRYSSTHEDYNGGRIPLRGIVGDGAIRQVDDTARALLLAGELLHVGKNTSLGFGRYTLVRNTRR